MQWKKFHISRTYVILPLDQNNTSLMQWKNHISPNFMDLCRSSTGSNQHKSNTVEDLCHSSTGSLNHTCPHNYEYTYVYCIMYNSGVHSLIQLTEFVSRCSPFLTTKPRGLKQAFTFLTAMKQLKYIQCSKLWTMTY